MPRDGRTLARTVPLAWAHLASHGRWTAPPHLVYQSLIASDVVAGREPFVLVSAPPRHGKSQFWSEYLPGFYVGNKPDNQVLLSSYESTLAANFGGKARDAFAEFGPLVFGHGVNPKRNARDDWRIQGRLGGMKTAGVGGSLTGRGADLLLIDDPIKNSEEANSQTIRDKVWDWWLSTARTRLHPGGAAVVVQTRWHEDDLAGRLIKAMRAGGDRWKIVNLTAIAEAGDVLGRAVGQALWPERYNEAWMLATQTALGPYWWSALYMGRPQPSSGGIFKRQYFRYFTEDKHHYILERPGEAPKRIPKDRGYRFSTTDLAASTSTTADYTVTATWFCTRDGDLLLLDVWRDRIEGPDQLVGLENGVKRFKLSFAAVEAQSYQLTIVQTLRRNGVPVMELHADSDKVSRAMTAAARMSGGAIYFAQGALWLDALESELLAFPRGTHDDQVDAVAYAAIHVAQGIGGPTAESL